jgi:hypothetical protein
MTNSTEHDIIKFLLNYHTAEVYDKKRFKPLTADELKKLYASISLEAEQKLRLIVRAIGVGFNIVVIEVLTYELVAEKLISSLRLMKAVWVLKQAADWKIGHVEKSKDLLVSVLQGNDETSLSPTIFNSITKTIDIRNLVVEIGDYYQKLVVLKASVEGLLNGFDQFLKVHKCKTPALKKVLEEEKRKIETDRLGSYQEILSVFKELKFRRKKGLTSGLDAVLGEAEPHQSVLDDARREAEDSYSYVLGVCSEIVEGGV